jgi:protein-S-isoprenylcysteine O-methyltransferase Ste14
MRILLLVLGRALVSIVVLGAIGGVTAITHPVALAFLAIEAGWSLTEGLLARAELTLTREQRIARARAPLSDGARRFLFAGKRYALANLIYHVIVLGEFAWRAPLVRPALGPLTVSGLCLYVLGAAVRGWAMASMGERFKSWTVTQEARGLERSGPYRLVRHPSYLGLALIALALPLIFGQLWLLAVALLPMSAIAGRIDPEERLLREAYPGDYVKYASDTRARLIPGVW